MIQTCNDINLLIISLKVGMMKFKQIRKSIISERKDAIPLAKEINVDYQQDIKRNQNLSFRKIAQTLGCSPLAERRIGEYQLNSNCKNVGSNRKGTDIDSNRKGTDGVTAHLLYGGNASHKKDISDFKKQRSDFKKYRSDSKENDPRFIQFHTNAKAQNSAKKLEFGTLKKRKNQFDQNSMISPLEDSKTIGNNLSFKNLIESKRNSSQSQNKNKNLESERNNRESSINKLKQKLFGMKKIISEKETSESIYTKKTEGSSNISNKTEGSSNISTKMAIKKDDLREANVDLVNMSTSSIKSKAYELDMSPHF